MKTKEEILAKWRQPLKEETGHDIEKICLLEAMEEYAQAYHEDKTRELNEELKSLRCELNAIYESEAGADL